MFRQGFLPLLTAALFCIGQTICGAATIGNVVSWASSNQDITFTINDGSKLRISILADDLVRFRFAPNGNFSSNISRAVIKTNWPICTFTIEETSSLIRINTGELKVEIQKNPCVVVIKDSSGNIVLSDDPTRRIEWGSNYTRVYKLTQAGESYIGLGWRPCGGIKRNGTSFTMRNVPTYDRCDVFYGGIPFWYGLIPGKAYGVFFDDTSWGEINVGAQSNSYMYFNNLGGQVDYYFFYGPAISKILNRYTELTGRPFLPPKWACGYQQSRWSYTPQSTVLSIANEFRNRNIPCDAIYLDIDYMNAGQPLTFNPSTFPNPASLCSTLHSQGFHVIANISPWLLYGSPMWNEANNKGYLLKKNTGDSLIGWFDYIYFVMGAPTGSVGWVDFSNTAAKTWYKNQMTNFLAQGIDGIWNDLNEPQELGSEWPSDIKYYFDGNVTNHCKTSSQYCILQTDMSYDALRQYYPNKRPFVLSRGAYAGIQRSSAVWSGDNTSDWTNDFRRNITMGLCMSLSGQPHNGHDIGGFYGYPNFSDQINSELYARWMQAGVFSPFCRQHHHGNGSQPGHPYCEPWRYGTTVENICRNFINLRYQLMPYLYSLFYEAHISGAPIQRPTVYDFQSDSNTLTQDCDFMFGPFMLISPVYTQGATSRSVYLPAGTSWTDWWTETRYSGGQTVTAPAPLDKIPIFVKDGAIIPVGPTMQYANQIPISQLTLKLYPSTTPSSFTLFEDNGIGWDYQSGQLALTTYTLAKSGTTVTLEIAARSGSYIPSTRSYLAEIHNWTDANVSVTLNGSPLTQYPTMNALLSATSGFYYASASRTLYARFPDSGTHIVLSAQVYVPPATPIGIAKTLADGVSVTISGIVTAKFPITGNQTRIYIQNPDRSCGIGVETTTVVSLGDEVRCTGNMGTNNGEKILNASSVIITQTGSPIPKPLSMTNLALGGGQFGSQPAVTDNATSSFFSVQTNNVGLLVRTWGKVTHVDPQGAFFYIDDGSGITDGSGQKGIRVACAGLDRPTLNTHVRITGISGTTLLNGKVVRLLKPRSVSDLSYFQPTVNYVTNPGFETGNLSGWTTYGTSGSIYSGPWFGDITAHSGTYFLGAACHYCTVSGGVYQRIAVPTGLIYRAKVWSRVFYGDNSPESAQNKVGIDPTGGTDPNAPSVQWSPVDIQTTPYYSGWRELQTPNVQCSSGYVTIFLDGKQFNTTGWHINCFDDASVSVVGG